jgi:hypothetical protein
MKALFATLALVLGLTFGAATFVQADEKVTTTEKKEEKKSEKSEKKTEKKTEKK